MAEAIDIRERDDAHEEVAGKGVKVRESERGPFAIWENPELSQTVLRVIPQKRIAETEEITGIALYLASEASSFTTGGTFLVDGGQWVDAGLSV